VNGKIEFVANYSDLSTEKGFQFEFNCDRCSTGFRTRVRPWTAGSVSSVLDAAGSLLGGVFTTAPDVGERGRASGWQKAHDEAFLESVQETRAQFMQCPSCSQWVCRRSCWSSRRGLCKDCSPDLAVETSATQASRSGEEAWAPAEMAEEGTKLADGDRRETIVASCPNCGAPQSTHAKFCPECGTKLKGG